MTLIKKDENALKLIHKNTTLITKRRNLVRNLILKQLKNPESHDVHFDKESSLDQNGVPLDRWTVTNLVDSEEFNSIVNNLVNNSMTPQQHEWNTATKTLEMKMNCLTYIRAEQTSIVSLLMWMLIAILLGLLLLYVKF
jgi:hypothetical protein